MPATESPTPLSAPALWAEPQAVQRGLTQTGPSAGLVAVFWMHGPL